MESLRTSLLEIIEASGGEISLDYRDLGSSRILQISPDVRMHAASTMKVPVMIQLFKDRDDGRLNPEARLQTLETGVGQGGPLTPQIVHHGGYASSKGLRHVRYFIRSGVRFFNDHGWRWI